MYFYIGCDLITKYAHPLFSINNAIIGNLIFRIFKNIILKAVLNEDPEKKQTSLFQIRTFIVYGIRYTVLLLAFLITLLKNYSFEFLTKQIKIFKAIIH